MSKRLLRQAMLATLIAVLYFTPATAQLSIHSVNHYLKNRSEGKKLKSYLRYELGYSMAFSSAYFQQDFRYINPQTNSPAKSLLAKSFSFHGLSVHAGTYFPLAPAGNGIIALNVSVFGNVFSWDLGSIPMDSLVTGKVDAAGAQIGIPIGVDYKFGGEVSLDKTDRFSFTAGAGIAPTVYLTSIAQQADLGTAKFGLVPYLKAEFGFFAGIEWKVKAMYQTSSKMVIDNKSGDPNLQTSATYTHVELQTRPVFTIGLALMPFSWDWENSGW